MNILLYPKIYAVIIKRCDKERYIIAKSIENEREYKLHLSWKNGKGSTSNLQVGNTLLKSDFNVGAKIKIYYDNKSKLKFRKIGS